jgi:peptidoglycan/xylan/chitin deacetylase (PgdA/CDA1 family)
MLQYIKRIIKLIISLSVFAFDGVSGLVSSMFNKKRTKCVILYYHAVYPEERRSFALQMDDLVRWTKPVTLNEINSLNQDGHYCVVTFDDGFTCIMDNALPELAKRNIPTTLFIPSACLGKNPQWLDGGHSDHKNLVMTELQLRSLNKNMTLIGSHGRTHRNLLQIGDEEAKKEIVESKKELETIINTPVETISFPHGDFNQNHIDMAIAAGYKKALSILPELIHAGSNGFVLGRVRVDPSDWRIEFRLKLSGAYRWMPRAFAIKKMLHLSLFTG